MMKLLTTNLRSVADGMKLANSFVVACCRYHNMTNLKFTRPISSTKGPAALRRNPVIIFRSGYKTSQMITYSTDRSSSVSILSMRNRYRSSNSLYISLNPHYPAWGLSKYKYGNSCSFHRCQHKLAEKQIHPDDKAKNNLSGNQASKGDIDRIGVTGSTGPPKPMDTPTPVVGTTPPDSSTLGSSELRDLPLPVLVSPQLQPESLSNASPPQPPKPKKRVSKFVFSKFFTFVQGYNKVLEKNFPGAMNVYRVFVVGFKDFSKELADYVRISTKLIMAVNGVKDLSSLELDVYYRMPKEMFRVAPTLIISALPLMNYVMFPIAYKFPKRLLSSHFWSIQQKAQFAIDFQKQRLFNYRPVFRCLQANVALASDKHLQKKCREILDKLGSGSHPSGREIMDVKSLFESDPFSLKAIYGPHVKGLCRMHGIHTMYLNRRRLSDRAEMLHVMDMAMIHEGIFKLKTDELKAACFIRGLNASNTSHEDMLEYLQQWTSISTSIGPHSYSLLLHLPILLAYNNPNNWALLA